MDPAILVTKKTLFLNSFNSKKLDIISNVMLKIWRENSWTHKNGILICNVSNCKIHLVFSL